MRPRTLTVLLALTLLLAACSSAVDKNDNADEGDDDYYGPSPEDTTPMEVSEEKSFEYESYVKDDGSWDIMVYWNNEKLATLNKEKPADGHNVELLEKTDKNLYVAINYTGLGGYILYGGAHSVYRINLETQTIDQIWGIETSTNYVTDISPDESSFVAFFLSEVGESILSIVPIESQLDAEAGSVGINYIVSNEFDEAGEGKFSPDGSQLAYAASIKGDSEEVTALFVIDLDTGKTREVTRKTGTGKVVWQDNETVVLD